jgi:hypothetical protein
LDPEKNARGRKTGRAQKPAAEPIDLSGIPDYVVEGLLEWEARRAEIAARRAAVCIERNKRPVREREARFKARRSALKAIGGKGGVFRVNNGADLKALAAMSDWSTLYELRTRLAGVVPSYHLRKILDRLWREGRVLKRLNPDRSSAAPRGLAKGNARCLFQYKAA